MLNIKNFLKSQLSAIYPKKCICCSELIDENSYLCEKCEASIERNTEDICLYCGFEGADCVCKYNVYRFKQLLCVFKNCGLAQKAYYNYKFYKKQHYSEFFALEMCAAIKKHFGDIKFDFVCSVPSYINKGYDHSGFLTEIIAENLNLIYEKNILSCVKRVKKQHKSSIKERITNTEGKYRCNYSIKDKNVLLIDDIKTTGATLDECAKELLFAGASSVYCVTVLGSSTGKK
ncbi:MAG: ComF family protein [Ruminococcaceae bacterium]|nr:ComF family protein [Oscillospiraceae bacterium]